MRTYSVIQKQNLSYVIFITALSFMVLLLSVAMFRAGEPEVQYIDLRLEKKFLIKINAQKYPFQEITFSTYNHPAATNSTLQVLPSMCSVLSLLLYLQVHMCAYTHLHMESQTYM